MINMKPKNDINIKKLTGEGGCFRNWPMKSPLAGLSAFAFIGCCLILASVANLNSIGFVTSTALFGRRAVCGARAFSIEDLFFFSIFFVSSCNAFIFSISRVSLVFLSRDLPLSLLEQ